jgi:hypothetical protein
MKPFEESHFSRLITKKLQEANLSHEENEYVTACLLSEDPSVSTRSREIISDLLEKHSSTSPSSAMKPSELKEEYKQLMASLKPKNNKASRHYLVAGVLLAIVVLVLIILLLLSKSLQF